MALAFLVSAGFGGMAAGPAGAMNRPVNLVTMTERAGTIVSGRITALHAGSHPRYRNIGVLYVTVQASEVLKGQPAQTVTFMQFTGRLMDDNGGKGLTEAHPLPDMPSYRVGEEVVSFPRHGREGGEPAHMIGRDALQVSVLTAALLPMVTKGLVLIRDGSRAETVRGQQEHVVVAEQHLDSSPGPGSLLLQSHDQVDSANPVRSVIDQIAHEPEGTVRAAPGLGLVGQLRAAQHIAQLL